jgi:hypothetical protein
MHFDSRKILIILTHYFTAIYNKIAKTHTLGSIIGGRFSSQ